MIGTERASMVPGFSSLDEFLGRRRRVVVEWLRSGELDILLLGGMGRGFGALLMPQVREVQRRARQEARAKRGKED